MIITFFEMFFFVEKTFRIIPSQSKCVISGRSSRRVSIFEPIIRRLQKDSIAKEIKWGKKMDGN